MRYEMKNFTVSPSANSNNVTLEMPHNQNFAQKSKRENLGISALSTSNHRGSLFFSIHTTLETMKSLPECHSFSLDPEVAARAQDLLSVLRWNFNIEAPRIFPQEHDVLVMKWQDNSLERFLSVTQDDVDLLDINPHNGIRCVHDLTEQGEIALRKLHDVLSMPERNSSAMDM